MPASRWLSLSRSAALPPSAATRRNVRHGEQKARLVAILQDGEGRGLGLLEHLIELELAEPLLGGVVQGRYVAPLRDSNDAHHAVVENHDRRVSRLADAHEHALKFAFACSTADMAAAAGTAGMLLLAFTAATAQRA